MPFLQAKNASILSWKCTICEHEMSFSTSTKLAGSKGNQYWTSNLAAVWGQMVTGGGFNPLQESMSVLAFLLCPNSLLCKQSVK